MKILAFLGIISVAILSPLASAEESTHIKPIQDLVNSKIKIWASDPVVVKAINAQNAEYASLAQSDIDRLDKTWRAETKASNHPMIDKIMSNSLSQFLKTVKEQSSGLYTEIFVMDNKGLNVGQSDPTSDYWQGDEAKWKKTFMVGPNAIHVGKVKEDESTQMLQAQASIPIVDPKTNAVIGAVTIGVNVEQVM